MRILLKTILFSGLIAIAVPSLAQVQLSINFGPPQPHYEVRGEVPYVNAVWLPGYYAFNDGRRDYDWVPGRWQAPPSPGHVWVAPRYVHRDNKYYYYEGNWRDNGKQSKGKKSHDNGKHEGKQK